MDEHNPIMCSNHHYIAIQEWGWKNHGKKKEEDEENEEEKKKRLGEMREEKMMMIEEIRKKKKKKKMMMMNVMMKRTLKIEKEGERMGLWNIECFLFAPLSVT